MNRKCVTYLQLENESESSGLTENFVASGIVMHCWPTGKLTNADIQNIMFRITSKI